MSLRPVDVNKSSSVEFGVVDTDSSTISGEKAAKVDVFTVGSASDDLGRVNAGNGRSLTKEQVKTMLQEAIRRNGIRQSEQLPEPIRAHLDRAVAESGLDDEGKAGLRNALSGKLLQIYGTA